jgi:hypothetical protein
MSNTAGATIKLRRDTAAAWASANPVLAAGEPGLETDTNLIKYGNGSAAWNSLPYAGVFSEVSSNVLPTLTDTYSLGSPSQRWKDLYVSANSIYIGDLVLSDDGTGQLAVNGSTVADSNNTLSNRGPDEINWNLMTQMGLYTVSRTSWSGTVGTPLDSQVFIGTLEILVSSTATDTSITQNFYPGEQLTNAAVQFTRSNWNGTWTNWQKVVNTNQIVSGGEF